MADIEMRVLETMYRQLDELERYDERRDAWRWLQRCLCAIAGRRLG